MSITFLTQNGEITCSCEAGNSLFEVIGRAEGIFLDAPCGGCGTCGKCTVFRVTQNGETPVLACRTPARDDEIYRVPAPAKLQVSLTGTSACMPADPGVSGYGIACDIGTTTVVCRLVDLSTGTAVAYLGDGNAQRAYGGDVIARIKAAGEGKLAALRQAITGQLTSMITALCSQAGIRSEDISRMSVAANTTMCHLLCGLDPAGIGRAPFTPLSRFGVCEDARELGMPFDGAVYIAPAVSGYVGGDITSDILAAQLDQAQNPVLMIDVGTNGEMALGCGDHFICCSTAAGPAFEGAQISCGMTASPGAISSVEWKDGAIVIDTVDHAAPVGICGSGLIDAVAVMLEIGAVDETGRMMDVEEDEDEIEDAVLPYLFLDENDHPAFRLCETVYVTQADVRKLQLGKGAIGAGEKVLIDRYGLDVSGVGELLLAGGFGSYIRPESAARIGLIPQELLPVTRAIGNAACEGAHAALVSAEARMRLGRIQEKMEYYELSGSAEFNEAYMDAMLFPGEE